MCGMFGVVAMTEGTAGIQSLEVSDAKYTHSVKIVALKMPVISKLRKISFSGYESSFVSVR